MKFIQKYFYLMILTLMMLLGAVAVCMIADVPQLQLSAEVVSQPEFLVANPERSQTERVTIYDTGDGNCYVFLPSYAELERVTVTAGKGHVYTLDDVELSGEMNCGSFRLDTPYDFAADGIHLADLWFRRSENMPALYVDTISGNLEGILHDTYPEESARTRLYTADGRRDFVDEYTKIKCRGYSSWAFDKKSFTLSLNKSSSLLDMGTSEKWTLTANCYDETHLRNKTVYSIADAVAPYPAWSPDCDYVELYLNGEYAGLYLLCQKPDTGPDYINLAPEDYYFEMVPSERRVQNGATVDFCESQSAEIKFPKNCDESRNAFLQDYLESFHEALLSEDGTAWMEYIDLDSWARKYLIEEVFSNCDGGRASHFYWQKASDGKLYAGHCWDYDLSLGITTGMVWESPYSMLVQRDWKQGTSWFGALCRKEEFMEVVKELYEKEFRPLLQTYTEQTIPAFAQQISGAIESEYLRWPELHDNKDWEPAVEEILAFLEKRIAFLDELWLEEKTYYAITVAAYESNLYVPAGVVPEDLMRNELDPDGLWYLEGTDIPFDATRPLTGDVRLSLVPASKISPPTEEVTDTETAPEESYATQDYITFASIAFFLCVLLCFAAADFFQRRKDRRDSHGRSRSKVSP